MNGAKGEVEMDEAKRRRAMTPAAITMRREWIKRMRETSEEEQKAFWETVVQDAVRDGYLEETGQYKLDSKGRVTKVYRRTTKV
jgi:hypothetical protein